eukprot:4648543-Pleurochrysis_carterae.AAC.4
MATPPNVITQPSTLQLVTGFPKMTSDTPIESTTLTLPSTCSATAEVYLVTRKLQTLRKKLTNPERKMSPQMRSAPWPRSSGSWMAGYSKAAA